MTTLRSGDNQVGELVVALAELEAQKYDVPLTTIHVKNTEGGSLQQYRINDVHRRARFGRYANGRP